MATEICHLRDYPCVQAARGGSSVLQDENLSDMLIYAKVLVTEVGQKEAVSLPGRVLFSHE